MYKSAWACASVYCGLIIASATNADELNGKYVMEMTGDAELSPLTAICKAQGTTAAAIAGTIWTFKDGKVSASSFGFSAPSFSIGATTCNGSKNERRLDGIYSIVGSVPGGFLAQGKLSFIGTGKGVNDKCIAIALRDVEFTVIGKPGGPIEMQTLGTGPKSIYAEGPEQGWGLTCRAEITNFVVRGQGF